MQTYIADISRYLEQLYSNQTRLGIMADYPIKGQMGFQDPASDWMYAIIDLHDRIIFYQIIIQSVVICIFISAQLMKDHLAYLHHGDLIEQIWTQTPAGIQWAIGLPSQRQLYIMDEILDAEITIKAIGNQWCCSNAINKSKYFANRNKILKNLKLKYENPSSVLNPFWVTGFSDANGCFSINIQVTMPGTDKNPKKTKKFITSIFKIALDLKDIDILYSQRSYFKIGQISIHKYEARLEILGFKNAIEYIIPHFDKYPQITQKQADYIQWKNIVMLQNSKQHLSDAGFLQCISYKASLNKGQNETLKTQYPNIIPASRPLVEQPEIINSYWLSGFTAGNGSFMIIIRKDSTCITGYQIQAAFNINLPSKDIKLLNCIRNSQGCGSIFKHKNDSRIVVVKLSDNLNKILPKFTLYPLMNRKQQEFIIWSNIVTMIENGEHKTNIGLKKIRIMRENIRQSRGG